MSRGQSELHRELHCHVWQVLDELLRMAASVRAAVRVQALWTLGNLTAELHCHVRRHICERGIFPQLLERIATPDEDETAIFQARRRRLEGRAPCASVEPDTLWRRHRMTSGTWTTASEMA